MSSHVTKLEKQKLIHPPSWLCDNIHWEVITGSVAYGVSTDTSDMDVYGWCIPKKELVFPHLDGEILGFGKQKQRFEQYQQHGIKTQNKKYDISIYNIVRYFHLCMENNPNMIDSLFSPRSCILFSTQVGEMVREKRREFLHKGSFHKCKGYSYAQMSKLKNAIECEEMKNIILFEKEFNIPHTTTYSDIEEEFINPRTTVIKHLNVIELTQYRRLFDEGLQKTKRFESQKIHQLDCKFAMHLVRLILQAEQILLEHDLTLDREDRREILKSIRRGEWSLERVVRFFEEKEASLEKVYNESTLRHGPDESAIKELLLNCLEQHYGSLDKAIERPDKYKQILMEIKEICNQV